MHLKSFTQNKAIAAVLITLGLLLLLGIQNVILSMILFTVVMVPGLLLLGAAYYTEHEAASVLAIPGALIAGTGVLLVFQSLTGYWESWAYAWTLYGVFFGLGLMLMGQRLEEPVLMTIGRGSTALGGIAFVVLGIFFILVTNSPFKLLLVVALLGGGVYMMTRHGGRTLHFPHKGKRSDATVEENIRKIKIA